jgi:hypothetical protein
MDIRGAFDIISTDSIKDAMEKHSFDDTIKAWHGHYLKNSQCAATLGTTQVKADLDGGSPQGGVSSPVVGWSLAFDDLLNAYNTSSTLAIGFADNACFVQAGIDLSTVMRQAQWAMDRAVQWAFDRGLLFCPNKTAMLLFTRKAKKSYNITKKLKLYGKEIEPTRDVKFLGVWIDDKLNFNKHLQEKIKAAKRSLAMSRTTMRKT